MELHYEDGMHHEIERGIHAHIDPPSVEDVYAEGSCEGGCSDVDSNGVSDDKLSTNAIGLSENGSSDYDLNEDDFEDEEDDEEYEDESGEDDTTALIDDLQTKFGKLVALKIKEVEEFFDDAATFQKLLSRSVPVAEAQQHVGNSGGGASECLNVEGAGGGAAADEPPLGFGLNSNSKDNAGRAPNKCTITSNNASASNPPKLISVSTQTDIPISLLTQQSLGDHPVVKETDEEEPPKDPPEKARLEISQLRDVRDSLVTQRQQRAAELKQAKEHKPDHEFNLEESKVFEVEEAIEAVDTVIEFKNEVVLGKHQPNEPLSVSDTLNTVPGSNEAELVTKLDTLTINELRRLLCVFFSKVVELRSSSKKLEKQLEYTENLHDQSKRRLDREQKHLREMHAEYQTRIRMVLASNNTNSPAYSCFKRMDEQLAAAHKKQHDLERSLTELLVRHGYLVNGADYDVKQVVKMLGIESQLAGGGTGPTQTRNQPGTDRDRDRGQQVNARSRSSKGSSNLDRRRNGRQLDGHELSRIHRDTRLTDGWEREHRHALQQQPHPPPTAEVRREKRKIIIQPSSGGHPSSHGHGHSSHQNHHHQQPSSGHGSHHHGYK